MAKKSQDANMLALLKIGGVSWSLLTGSEKILFSLRAGIRVGN